MLTVQEWSEWNPVGGPFVRRGVTVRYLSFTQAKCVGRADVDNL